MRHLYRMSLQSERTGMTSKNLAIVWSPNILRCDVSELDTQDALQVRHKHLIFSRPVIGQLTKILSSHWLIGISNPTLSVITITSKYFYSASYCAHIISKENKIMQATILRRFFDVYPNYCFQSHDEFSLLT